MSVHVHGNWTGKFLNNAHKANECHPWKITLSPIKIYFKWISLFARVHELAIYIYKHITLATATPTNNKRKTELCCSFMNLNNNLDYQIQAIYIIASLMISRKYHLMFVNELLLTVKLLFGKMPLWGYIFDGEMTRNKYYCKITKLS